MYVQINASTPQLYIDDIEVARDYLHEIKSAFEDVKDCIDDLESTRRSVIKRDEEIEELKAKITASISSTNMWRYDEYLLQKQLEGLSRFDFKAKKKIKRQLDDIQEYLSDLSTVRENSKIQLLALDRNWQNKTEEKEAETIKRELYGKVKKFGEAVNEYRQFRSLFVREHGEHLPEVNMSDFVQVSNGEVSVIGKDIPFVSVSYYGHPMRTDTIFEGEECSVEILD